MQFKLILNGDGVRKHNLYTLHEAIHNLSDNVDNYILLEPKSPIRNSIYLQGVFENNGYKAEIRFIYGASDNFRHFSKVFNDLKLFENLFTDYYSKEIIPNIKTWVDETPSQEDNLDNDVVKLYQERLGKLHYSEFWMNDEGGVTIHEGIVGEIGETEIHQSLLPLQATMNQLIVEKRELGYKEIESLYELILQYDYDDSIDDESLQQKLDCAEETLNNGLGWTGNGHCEGGVVEHPGIITIVCYVVDVRIALQTMIEDLESENMLDGLHICCENESSSEYVEIYPIPNF